MTFSCSVWRVWRDFSRGERGLFAYALTPVCLRHWPSRWYNQGRNFAQNTNKFGVSIELSSAFKPGVAARISSEEQENTEPAGLPKNILKGVQETSKEGDCKVKLLWCLVVLQPSWLSLASPHPGAGIFLSHILTVLCGSSKLVFPRSQKNRWRGGVDLEDSNSCLTLETNRCWHFFSQIYLNFHCWHFNLTRV